jgi:uncharacterized protein (TIGR04255 family)
MGETDGGRVRLAGRHGLENAHQLLVAEHRQLSRPPLREALIDLRLAEELSTPVINDLTARQAPGFGSGVPMWRGGLTFQIGPSRPVVPLQQNPNELWGLRYTTADGSRILQLRRDGFTFSVMSGYTTWENARDSARALWRQYWEWTRAAEVGRVAVRYINVLAVPGGADFDLYLTAGPSLPPGIPETLSGFLHRVVVPFSPDGTSAIITQALEADGGVVLDIDVWREFRFRADSPNLWTTLDSLRDIKNRIFFASVTETALEPYI